MPGGGDAGSLLPDVLPPEFGAIVMGHRQRSLINILSAPPPPPVTRRDSKLLQWGNWLREDMGRIWGQGHMPG